MTKWFDTNYDYIVHEFEVEQTFQLSSHQLFTAIKQAQLGGKIEPKKIKPVLLGPLTFLWLGKTKGAKFDKLDLLKNLLPIYNQIFHRLAAEGIEWVQIDEP